METVEWGLILWYIQHLVSIAAIVRTEIPILEDCNLVFRVLPGAVPTILGPYDTPISTAILDYYYNNTYIFHLLGHWLIYVVRKRFAWLFCFCSSPALQKYSGVEILQCWYSDLQIYQDTEILRLRLIKVLVYRGYDFEQWQTV